MQLWLPFGVMAGYIFSAVLFIRVYRNILNPLWALGVMVLTCQLHALLLIRTLSTGTALNLSVFNMLSVNAWFVACLSLFWLWRTSTALGGVIICSVNVLAVLLPVVFISYKPFPAHLTAGIWWHILTSVTAWTFISLAFLHAVLYGWVFHNLKKKKLSNGSAVSLFGLERVMMWQAVAGFIFLSLALLTGFLFVDNLFAEHLLHKTVFTVLAWLTLLWTLFSYYGRNRRGTTLVYDLFAVFFLLFTGYVLSNIILQFIVV